jgi:hypothetical protein
VRAGLRAAWVASEFIIASEAGWVAMLWSGSLPLGLLLAAAVMVSCEIVRHFRFRS